MAYISLFPTLTEDLIKNAQINVKSVDFYYDFDTEKRILKCEDTGANNVYKLSDSFGLWNPDEFGFGLNGVIKIDNTSLLFGENGIADISTTLGIAIIWTSRTSRDRGLFTVDCNLKYSQKKNEIEFNGSFEKGQLRGRVEVRWILYIKNSKRGNDSYFATNLGTDLGSFLQFSIELDGKGSLFPIFTINDSSKPLWEVICDWTEPDQDQFNEVVKILINEDHKNYKYLDPTNKSYDPQLFQEIISSAMTIIVLKFRNDNTIVWDEFMNKDSYESGTVCDAMKYFVDTLEWKTSTPESLSLSIRQYFERKI